MSQQTSSAIRLHVEQSGSTGDRVVLVHGGGSGGAANFTAQQPLAERWTLLMPDRPGYGKSPSIGVKDFEQDAPYIADLLDDGAHLVGHSYGGIVALFAAALRPDAVLSLTVIEPPVFRIGAGDPDVDAFANDFTALFRDETDPETFMRRFLALSGVPVQLPPPPFPPPLLAAARETMKVRGPWEAVVPVERLVNAPFPRLVVSGGHRRAYEVMADALAAQIGAQRAVVAGKQHSVQEVGEAFNQVVEAFWTASRHD
jgi:pimeloyl-ACP methyl ester carboxylesterase